jgi:hypothetical protein
MGASLRHGLAAGLLACVPAAAQAPIAEVEARAGRVVLRWALEGVEGCPVAGRNEQANWHALRVDEALGRVADLVGSTPASAPPIELWVGVDEAPARAKALAVCERELQGLGVLATAARAAVLCPPREQRESGPLLRLLTHVATQVFVAQMVTAAHQDELGYGWLAAGLAHHATTALPDGAADTFVVRDVVWSARCWRSDFAAAAATLVQQERFPSLEALFATEQSDFDFAQHVAAFTLLAWLRQATPAPVTGERAVAPAPAPLARIVAAARAGTPAKQAMLSVLSLDLAAVQTRVEEFATHATPLTTTKKVDATPHRSHPHAALYLYATEPVAPRHRAVVDAALRRRHDAHTSGWRDDDGTPRVQLGAVSKRAAFWHGDELVKPVDRAWPFVVVLEYEPAGDPHAFLDCFRRAADHGGDDGWMLDPGTDFVAHHNAQFATASDEHFAYLAVPDAPTGSYVAGSEFVHRARVTWADGGRAVLGLQTILVAPKGKPAAGWHSAQTPLVDWRVLASSPRAGAAAVGSLGDPERELAVWGSERVLPLPAIPPGLFAGRGRQ